MVENQDARGLAKRVGVGLASAATGLAIGGPVGALAGAIAQPMLELLVIRERKGVANVALLEEIITDLSGLSAADVAAWARDRESRLHLVTTAMHAAYMTAVDRKIAALARVLVDNIRDDAKIEYSHLVIAALAQIEGPHIRVLHAMRYDTPPARPDGQQMAAGAWSESQLAAHLPGLASGISPITVTLGSTGMLAEGLAAGSGRDERQDADRAWSVTSFGVACLSRIEDSSLRPG